MTQLKDIKIIKHYTDWDGNIFLIYRDITKKILKIHNTKTYFYIKKEDIAKITFRYIDAKIEGDYYKIYYNYKDKRAIEEELKILEVKTYEYDLSPSENYALDNELEYSNDYKILHYDIETDDRHGGVVIGRDRILSICAIDNEGKEFVMCEDNEENILVKFVELIKDYDVICDWNGNHFDLPYIKERLKIYNIFFNFNTIMHLDLLKVFKGSLLFKAHHGEHYLPSYSLSAVSKAFLSETKISLEEEGEAKYGGVLFKLFTEDREKLIKYNMQDAKLLKLLDEKLDIIKNQGLVSVLSRVSLESTQWISTVIDMYTLRRSRKIGLHFKSRDFNSEHVKYEGGFVLKPTPGLFDNVAIFDFASLYPNLVRTFNLSPETELGDNIPNDRESIKTPAGFYYKKERGLIPSILDDLVVSRLKLKKEMGEVKLKYGKDSIEYINKEAEQWAIKLIILSYYGILGQSSSRYFSLDMARSITLSGQAIIQALISELDSKGYNVITGDTDSLMLETHGFDNIPTITKIIKDYLDIYLKNYVGEGKHYLEMKFEKFFSKYIIIAAKKYAGRVVFEDDKVDYFYTRGTELMKGSETLITKKLLKEIFDYILYEDFIDVRVIKNIVYKYKKLIFNGEVTVEDILQVKEVSSMPEAYKVIPPHVQLAIDRKEKGEFYYTSMKVNFIVLGEKPMKIIHIDDYKGVYDKKYYWQKVLYPPTMRVLNIIFPTVRWESLASEDNTIQMTLLGVK